MPNIFVNVYSQPRFEFLSFWSFSNYAMEWARRLIPSYFSAARHGTAQFAGAEVKEEVLAHLLADDYTETVFAVGNSNPEGRSFFAACRSEHYSARINGEQLDNFQLRQRYRAETLLGCMLRMTNEHVIVFFQVVLGIIMLYCGCPDIIWDILTMMRLVNSKRVVKAYALEMGTQLRQLQPGESKKLGILVADNKAYTLNAAMEFWSVDRRKLFLQTVNWYWVPIAEALIPSCFRGATKPRKISKKNQISSRESRSQV